MGKKWEKTKEFCKENKELAVSIVGLGVAWAGLAVSGLKSRKANEEVRNHIKESLTEKGWAIGGFRSSKEFGTDKPIAIIYKVLDDSMEES